MNKSKAIFLWVFGIFALTAYFVHKSNVPTEEYPVTFMVVDAGGNALSGATITCVEYTSKVGITDSNGKRTLYLPDGTYTFDAVKGNMKGTSDSVTLPLTDHSIIEIMIEEP
jgi:hypothetical protein